MISYCTPSFVSKLCFRQGSLESDIFVCSFSLSLSHSMWPTLMRVQRTWEAKRTCGENSTWMVKHHLSTNLSEIFTLSHPAPLSNQLTPPPPPKHTHTHSAPMSQLPAQHSGISGACSHAGGLVPGEIAELQTTTHPG